MIDFISIIIININFNNNKVVQKRVSVVFNVCKSREYYLSLKAETQLLGFPAGFKFNQKKQEPMI